MFMISTRNFYDIHVGEPVNLSRIMFHIILKREEKGNVKENSLFLA